MDTFALNKEELVLSFAMYFVAAIYILVVLIY
jgi:hypothetical protein